MHTHRFRLSWLIASSTALLLLSGCGQNVSQRPTNEQMANRVASSQGTSGNTSSKASNVSAGGNTTASRSASTWPAVGQWPTVTVHASGKLPLAMLGNALSVAEDGTVASVGGYTGVVSLTGIYTVASPSVKMATLPQRTHDAAAAYLGNSLLVIGGGQATSYNTLVEVKGGQATVAGHLSQPLSDAVAVPLTVDGTKGVALVGGYNGSVYRTSVSFVKLTPSGTRVWSNLFKLADEVRYASVASSGDTLYIAGGRMTSGLSNGVYMWSSGTKELKKVATLSHGVEKAAMYVAGPYLIMVGGEGANGVPTRDIVGIDTRSGQSKVLGQLPTPLADMGYAQVGNHGILAGGVTTARDTDVTAAISTVTWSTK